MGKRFAIVVGVAAAGVMALGAQSATAAPNICIAENGVVREQSGTATCEATGEGSLAKAKGAKPTPRRPARERIGGRSATAAPPPRLGDHNTAIANGDGSLATAGIGERQHRHRPGDCSSATASDGDNNTATVTGDNSSADARGFGDNNTATVIGEDSSATRRRRQQHRHRHRRRQRAAAGYGNDNTATVDRQRQHRHREAPTGCTAEATRRDTPSSARRGGETLDTPPSKPPGCGSRASS